MDADCEVMQPSPKACCKPDLREGLENTKRRFEQKLAEINDAIKALDDNPEVAKVLELVGKASRY